MAPRTQLQTKLLSLCPNVYFQPPPDFKLKYPCIIYKRNNILIKSADNISYNVDREYVLTIIDLNPDSSIIDEILTNLSRIKFERHFTKNGLNHDIFKLIF